MTNVNQSLYEENRFSNAEDFLDMLTGHRPHALFEKRRADDWIFRGQRDATWPLQPSAFRWLPIEASDSERGHGPFLDFKPAQREELRIDHWHKQIEEEAFYALRFNDHVCHAGFEVPGDRPELRTQNQAPTPEPGWEFPRVEHRFMYALAQHYGMPTRLLDWSQRPLVAAYFAARDAAERELKGECGPSENLAVWCVSRTFVAGQAQKWTPVRPVIVTVPTASNPNLRAQFALFTLVVFNEGRTPTTVVPPHLDDLFKDPEHSEEAVGRNGFEVEPMLIKLTLPTSESRRLLFLLHRLGVDVASLCPGLHSITAAMKEQRLWKDS